MELGVRALWGVIAIGILKDLLGKKESHHESVWLACVVLVTTRRLLISLVAVCTMSCPCKFIRCDGNHYHMPDYPLSEMLPKHYSHN